jgi:hypothetical protein
MVKNKFLRASALVAASAGLMLNVAGVAGASSSSGVISTTGFDSLNKVINKNSLRAQSSLKIANQNNVAVGNMTDQSALTGDARASKNTTGGSVLSGDAANHSATSTSLSIHNSTPSLAMPSLPSLGGGSGTGSIGTTGADSSNLVINKQDASFSSKVTVANRNNVAVFNNTDQTAVSGDASASKNTTVGNVLSGDASNTSTTTTTVNISN